ncbi:MAG: MoxR family ATPase [Clostridiales bacterium]|nr:MoxR family ATPase [Clostridiales bacterium]
MDGNRELLYAIVQNMEKVIIGKRAAVEYSLLTLISGGHLLVVDVPGVGKTSLVSSLAKSVNGSFKRVQFTPDVLPSDITGFVMYNKKNEEFVFRHGAVDCNFLLADEINRTSPKTQSSLLEAMEDGRVSVDGQTYELPQPFMVMATQNPIEYVGTYPLPEAQLDRFFMKISLGYPGVRDEVEIVSNRTLIDPIDEITPVASVEDIKNIQEEVRHVNVETSLINYIVRLADATRNDPEILLGMSPRAVIALRRAGQAMAYYKGRDYVLPEDIKILAQVVLPHRMILSQEAKVKKLSPEAVINRILNMVSLFI